MTTVTFDGTYYGDLIKHRNDLRSELKKHEIISKFCGEIILENNAEGDPKKFFITSMNPENLAIRRIIISDFEIYF